jgi:hypothetical protein
MRRFIFAGFALTVLAACQPATTELTEEQKAEIEAEVDGALDALWDLFREADYERGIVYWEHSPDLVFAGTAGGILVGFSTLDNIYRPFFETIASQEINIAERHFKVITLDAVYAMERGTYAQTDTAGVTGPTRPYAYTYLWVRTDAGWRISAGHMSAGDPVEQ